VTEPLNLLDKEEWWDVCRRMKPDYDREEYERDWAEFQKRKREREMQ